MPSKVERVMNIQYLFQKIQTSLRLMLVTLGLSVSLSAWAQFKVDISGVGLVQLPVAVVPFRAEEAHSQRVSQIVGADLARSGQVKMLELPAGSDESSKPDTSGWRQKGAEYVLVGSVTRLADGRLDVRYKLWDALRGTELLSTSAVAVASELRATSHQIADLVYEKLTGVRGVFSTRIAYVTKSPGKFHLWVADADGENAQAPLSSAEPIISPVWSPKGTHLAYVSFEAKKPIVYVQELGNGQRRTVANFKGSNSAPAWAPDGNTLAVTLSRDGVSQIYLVDVQRGGEPRRLTRSDSIDTESVFSADGATLFFVSDRGGSPQIYRIPVTGGDVQRVTFTGNYNISPALSPDGRWMAYISRISGQFKLHVMDLNTGTATAITNTTADESPSFAPNGRLILYATRVQGKEALMTTTLDGQIKTTLAGSFMAIREPDWGPLRAAR
jgi:TolB protein